MHPQILPTGLRSDPLGELKHSPDRRATADIPGMEYPLTIPSRSLEPLVADEKMVGKRENREGRHGEWRGKLILNNDCKSIHYQIKIRQNTFSRPSSARTRREHSPAI